MLNDPEIELACVSEALRRYEAYVARGVAVSDYGLPQHQAVVDACAAVWETGAAVSVDSVALELQRASRLDFVGGYRGLAEMAAGGACRPDPDRLRELARLRTVYGAAMQVAKVAEQGLLHEALSALGDAQVEALSGASGKTLNAAELAQVVFEGLAADAKQVRRVHPGLDAFERLVGFLPLGSMTVIGGDTNVGKSSFVLETLFAAAGRNVGCGLVSVEDPDEVTGSRLLATVSGVSSSAIQRGKLTQDDGQRLAMGVETLKRFGDKLLFEDCTGGNELDVCAAMTRMAARGAKIVVVDYIQEIECSKKQQDRRNEVRWLVKRLKAHAKRLQVALMVVSQIARPKDGETGRKPSKHHLKESGDVTNSAEVILLLWRSQETDDAPIKVEVAKVKWGGVGSSWSMARSRERGGRLVEV